MPREFSCKISNHIWKDEGQKPCLITSISLWPPQTNIRWSTITAQPPSRLKTVDRFWDLSSPSMYSSRKSFFAMTATVACTRCYKLLPMLLHLPPQVSTHFRSVHFCIAAFRYFFSSVCTRSANPRISLPAENTVHWILLDGRFIAVGR